MNSRFGEATSQNEFPLMEAADEEYGTATNSVGNGAGKDQETSGR